MTELLLETRKLFNISHLNKKDCEAAIELTKNNSNPIISGYHYAVIIISAKYVFNPITVLSIFNKNKAEFEDVLSENYGEPELHFLRYSIQLQAPKFLNYYRNIDADRAILAQYLKANPNSDLTKHMMIYLVDTKDKVLDMI